MGSFTSRGGNLKLLKKIIKSYKKISKNFLNFLKIILKLFPLANNKRITREHRHTASK
jgi:hypothetical protein